jgi:murein DD-endopeptidase MepM/ murein hydrolase activator NlpD
MEQVEQVYINRFRADSLEVAIRQRDIYLENFMQRILLGEDLNNIDTIVGESVKKSDYTNIADFKSEEDSLLRSEWEGKENYDLIYYPANEGYSGISRFVFFTPVHGKVINGFDSKNRHYGVDILSKKDSPIKATLDGTVTLSTWTFEGGYVIIIQHDDDLVSVYKHNSTLLKSQGDRVKAGDPIAIIGNSGELSTGPHLHFELWYQRNPANPADFINFD